MLAENFAQSGLQQMRRGVVAHGGLADRGVDHGVHFVANANRGFYDHLMRADSLHRVVASLDLGDDGVPFVAVKRAAVTNLPSGFGIKRRVVEDDLAFFPGLQFLHALAVPDDRQHFAAFRPRLQIAFKHGFWQLVISGVRRLFGRAFPGSTSAFALPSGMNGSRPRACS